MFTELYNYRELLWSNVKKNIRGKYKASALGILWSFVNPLLQVLVYAIVFPYLLRNTGDNYLMYLITGIIPWTFFMNVITECVGCIKNNAGIIKKVYFPRIILPLSTAISGLVNFFISCIIILIFCLFTGSGITWHIIFVPLIALVQIVFTLGIGLVLSACDAYLQDLEYITTFILQMAFYGTPIVYQLDTITNVTSIISILVHLNPMTTIIQSYRDVFLYHTSPNLGSLCIVAVVSLLILFVGILIFKKLEKGFAEQF